MKKYIDKIAYFFSEPNVVGICIFLGLLSFLGSYMTSEVVYLAGRPHEASDISNMFAFLCIICFWLPIGSVAYTGAKNQ